VGPSGFEEEVERLATLALQLAPPRRLVGYSQGARLGLGVLIRTPELFERACLVGVNPGLESELERIQRRQWENGLAQKLQMEGVEAFLDEWENLPIFASQRAFPGASLEQREARRMHQPVPLARALVGLGLGGMPNYWPELRAVTVPIDLVVGDSDAKFGALAERAQSQFQHCEVHKIAAAGHNPLLEAPLAFTKLLNDLGYT